MEIENNAEFLGDNLELNPHNGTGYINGGPWCYFTIIPQ